MPLGIGPAPISNTFLPVKMQVVELREYISTWGDRSSMNQFIEGYRLEEKRKAETDFWKQEISQYLLWYDLRRFPNH